MHFKSPNWLGAAEKEALELQRIEHLRGTVNEVDAIRLHSYSSQENLLFTEFVPRAHTLFNELYNRSRWWRRWHSAATSFERMGAQVGAWLRLYHDTSLTRTSGYDEPVRFLTESGTRKLNALQEANSTLLSAATVQFLRSYFNNVQTSSNAWGPQNVSQIHGDFDLANILIVPPTRLVIVDFADSRIGFAAEDLVRCWHAAWTLSRLSPSVGTFASSLLDGYEIGRSELDPALVNLLRCWNAITFLLTAIRVRSRFSLGTRRLFSRLIEVNRHWLESLCSNPSSGAREWFDAS